MLAAFWRDYLRPQPEKRQVQDGEPKLCPPPPVSIADAVAPSPAPAPSEDVPAPAIEPVSTADAAAPSPAPVSSTDEVSSDSGSSLSDEPISRKARKLAVLKALKHNHSQRCETFAYAMLHGKFPQPGPAPQQPPSEHPMLTDPGYLWNAVPPRHCQYLDMEASHEGFGSPGSTGSSEGSLEDPDFIVKDLAHENHTEDELQVLRRMFPKTFK